ncbi:hypothetical protein BDZ89DRAFT_1037449 [Hymenopellis radicata]|nr:hypothetical protein BDZ89DRAFT_1037449 [Hymenopellis radicata]
MAQTEFMIGVEPFLFKIKGGPMPPSFALMQNSFVELAAVYRAGPEQQGQVAYREYNHYKRLSEITTDTFLQNVATLSSRKPLQMFGSTPNSQGMQLFRKLCSQAKRWRMDDGPGSLRQIKRDADLQAQRDGAYFRFSESPPPDDEGPVAELGAAAPDNEDADTSTATGQAEESENPSVAARIRHRHLHSQASPSSARRERNTRYPSRVPKRSLRYRSPADSSDNSYSAKDDDVRTDLQFRSLQSMREKGIGQNAIYKLLLKGPKEPVCSECEKTNAICYRVIGKKGKKGRWPACLRCGAMSLRPRSVRSLQTWTTDCGPLANTMSSPLAAIPILTGGSPPCPSLAHSPPTSQTAAPFYPDVRDRAACARFRLRRKAARARRLPHPHCQHATLSEDVAVLCGHVEQLYELVLAMQQTTAENSGVIHSLVRNVSSVLVTAFPQSFPISTLSRNPTTPTQADTDTTFPHPLPPAIPQSPPPLST